LCDPPAQLIDLSLHPEKLTKQRCSLGFARLPRSGQCATASQFRYITWDKTDLLHDDSRSFISTLGLHAGQGGSVAIRFLSLNWLGRPTGPRWKPQVLAFGLCYLAS
jgi:hypothetical protein